MKLKIFLWLVLLGLPLSLMAAALMFDIYPPEGEEFELWQSSWPYHQMVTLAGSALSLGHFDFMLMDWVYGPEEFRRYAIESYIPLLMVFSLWVCILHALINLIKYKLLMSSHKKN